MTATTRLDTIQASILRRLDEARLSPVIDTAKSHFQSLGGNIFVELVVWDADFESPVREALVEFVENMDVSLVVRAIWVIDRIDEAQAARSLNGNIVAAWIVPVWLRSGSKETAVNVAISYLAERELRRLTGRDSDLKDLAKAYVESFLRSAGANSWNPLRENYLEIDVGRALSLRSILAKTA